MKMNFKYIKFKYIFMIIVSVITCLTLCGCNVDFDIDDAIDAASNLYDIYDSYNDHDDSSDSSDSNNFDLLDSELMNHNSYNNTAYVVINNNKPFFDAELYKNSDVFESYSDLDSLNRPGVAFALLSQETMPGPDEERGAIGNIKPAGWHSVKYDIVNGKYLYNRCHLIGWQLSAENDNEKNLITGTRYLNIDGMLDFENQIADYLYDDPDNKVLYRVTPIYKNDNLICEGLLIEAKSFDDLDNDYIDSTIEFCIFCYNVQPGIFIDYATGDSYEK